MGTKKLILVPMGTKVPKWGPTWEQCPCMQLGGARLAPSYHSTSCRLALLSSTCCPLLPHLLHRNHSHLYVSNASKTVSVLNPPIQEMWIRRNIAQGWGLGDRYIVYKVTSSSQGDETPYWPATPRNLLKSCSNFWGSPQKLLQLFRTVRKSCCNFCGIPEKCL